MGNLDAVFIHHIIYTVNDDYAHTHCKSVNHNSSLSNKYRFNL